MLNEILIAFLKLSDSEFIIPLIIIGYTWINIKNFHHITTLLLLSLVINSFLKIFFKIPLSFKVGYAFPSGHMQSVTLLYGYMAYIFRQSTILKYILIIVIIAIGIGEIIFGYHNLLDIVMGTLVALMLILFHQILIIKNNISEIWMILLASVCIYCSNKLYSILPYYVMISFISLLQLVVCNKLLKINEINLTFYQKFLSTIVYIILTFVLYSLYRFYFVDFLKTHIRKIEWFCMLNIFLLPLSISVINKIRKYE